MPESEGGWRTVAPSPVSFGKGYATPEGLSAEQIVALEQAFATAAKRAYAAGFRAIEVHAAHGYLIHQFLSPLSNRRADAYGGSFDNRTRFLRDCVAAVRSALPDPCPLFVRISATDWTDGGWDLAQSIELSRRLKDLGVDAIDCSSGGNVESAKIPVGPGYQVPFSQSVRREAGIATAAVGMISAPAQADQIIRNGDADIVLIARELLRDPYWPLSAARELGQPMSWPAQYLRAARTRPSASRRMRSTDIALLPLAVRLRFACGRRWRAKRRMRVQRAARRVASWPSRADRHPPQAGGLRCKFAIVVLQSGSRPQ